MLHVMRKAAPARSTRGRPYRFAVIVVKEKREYWAYVPDLPGVYGRGRTAAAATLDIHQALELYVEDGLASGDSVPRSAPQVVNVDTLAVST